MMMTTFEKGVAQGREEGRKEGSLLGQRQIIRTQLEHRFGQLNETVVQRLNSFSAERLDELAIAFVNAKSLAELGLAD